MCFEQRRRHFQRPFATESHTTRGGGCHYVECSSKRLDQGRVTQDCDSIESPCKKVVIRRGQTKRGAAWPRCRSWSSSSSLPVDRWWRSPSCWNDLRHERRLESRLDTNHYVGSRRSEERNVLESSATESRSCPQGRCRNGKLNVTSSPGPISRGTTTLMRPQRRCCCRGLANLKLPPPGQSGV